MKYLAIPLSLVAISLPWRSVWADDQDVLIGKGTKIEFAKPIELGPGEHKAAFGTCTMSLMVWGAEVPKETSVTVAPSTLTVQGRDSVDGKWILLYGDTQTIKINCDKTTVGNVKTAFADSIQSIEVVPADTPPAGMLCDPKN
jgi:hypothetical protein